MGCHNDIHVEINDVLRSKNLFDKKNIYSFAAQQKEV